MRGPPVGVMAARLPPMDERRHRLVQAVLSRAGQRADDLAQEAWLAHLAGDDPLRRVGRVDRAARRRAQRERTIGTADLPPSVIRERY